MSDISIVIFNGPPGCGKDTAADACAQRIGGAYHLKFSAPLKNALQALAGIANIRWSALMNHMKDKDVPEFHNPKTKETFTPRQALIMLSEEFAKQYFGAGFFGLAAVRQIQNTPLRIAVFSDGGFPEEIQELMKVYGGKNILIVQIMREGCTFEHDSRSYIEMQNVTTVQLHNHLDRAMFREQAIRIVQKWLESK